MAAGAFHAVFAALDLLDNLLLFLLVIPQRISCFLFCQISKLYKFVGKCRCYGMLRECVGELHKLKFGNLLVFSVPFIVFSFIKTANMATAAVPKSDFLMKISKNTIFNARTNQKVIHNRSK